MYGIGFKFSLKGTALSMHAWYVFEQKILYLSIRLVLNIQIAIGHHNSYDYWQLSYQT